jgi:hypothetical protein
MSRKQSGCKESDTQEKEIVRLLLLYGNKMIDWDGIANTYIGPFMIAELSDVEFEQPDEQTFYGDLPAGGRERRIARRTAFYSSPG